MIQQKLLHLIKNQIGKFEEKIQEITKLKSVLRGHQVGKRVLRKEDRQKKERRRPHGDMFWQLFFFLLLIN